MLGLMNQWNFEGWQCQDDRGGHAQSVSGAPSGAEQTGSSHRTPGTSEQKQLNQLNQLFLTLNHTAPELALSHFPTQEVCQGSSSMGHKHGQLWRFFHSF